jgi:hypothetical protein
MSGFLTRLAERTLGLARRADARPVSRFEPDGPMPNGRPDAKDEVAGIGLDILERERGNRPDDRAQPRVDIERTSTAPAEQPLMSGTSPPGTTQTRSEQSVSRRREAPGSAAPPHQPPASVVASTPQGAGATERGRSPPAQEPGSRRRPVQSPPEGAHPPAPPERERAVAPMARAHAEARRAETPLYPAVPDVAVSARAPTAQGERVEVTIDRIDVRVPPSASSPTRSRRAAALDRIPSLSDYLSRRRE